MAKILSIVGTLSGSINGTTYSHNKGGAYIRARKIPTISASPKTAFAKALLGGLSPIWATLSNTQRTEWANWAVVNPIVDALGQSIQMSGQQAFLKLNLRLVGSGQDPILSPPVDTGPAQLLTLAVTVTVPASLSCAFTPVLPTGGTFCLWQCLPGTAGQDPNFNQARLVGYSMPDATTPQVFTTPYPLIAGNVCNFWATVMDVSGRIAPVIKDRVLVP